MLLALPEPGVSTLILSQKNGLAKLRLRTVAQQAVQIQLNRIIAPDKCRRWRVHEFRWLAVQVGAAPSYSPSCNEMLVAQVMRNRAQSPS